MSFTQVYVFIRKDLTHPQQIVQSCHACLGLRQNGSDSSVIVIGIEGEGKLYDVITHLKSLDLDYSEFREPDIGNELTAVVSQPIPESQKNIFRKYQLLKGGQHV